MNGCSRRRSVAAREMRAKAGMEKNARAKMVLRWLGPRLCATARVSTNEGNAMNTSSTRMMMLSTAPPKWALSAPSEPPRVSPSRFTEIATISDDRPP